MSKKQAIQGLCREANEYAKRGRIKVSAGKVRKAMEVFGASKSEVLGLLTGETARLLRRLAERV